MLLQAIIRRGEGYTAVRMGTAEEGAAADADEAALDEGGPTDDVGYATGIDDFDVAVDTEGAAVDVDLHQQRAAASYLAAVLRRGGVMVNSLAGRADPLSDYDRDFAPLTYPTVFPYGEGGRPEQGMGEDEYFRLVLERRAARGRGDNVGMLLAFYDIHARHAVNNSTYGRALATPDTFAELDRISEADLNRLYNALRDGMLRSRVPGRARGWGRQSRQRGRLADPPPHPPCLSTCRRASS
jgi:hypothetical protein